MEYKKVVQYSFDYSLRIDIKKVWQSSCPYILDPVKLGKMEDEGDSGSKDVRFDLRSVMTALSINMGIIDYEIIDIVNTHRADSAYTFPMDYCNTTSRCKGLTALSFTSYSYSLRYPGMKKLYCILWTDGTSYINEDGNSIPYGTSCFYREGNYIMFPAISHWYEDICNCSTLPQNEEYISFYKSKCSDLEVLLSFLLFPDETMNFFPLLLEIAADVVYQLRQRGDDTYFNRKVHPVAHTIMGGDEEDYIFNSTTNRNNFDTLCNSNNCTLIVFNLNIGFDAFKHDVNEFYFDIPYIACNNTAYVPSVFQELISTQPSAFTLQNEYFSCRPTETTIISYVFGVAVGNATLAASLIMFVYFFLLGRYLRYYKGYRTGIVENFNKASSKRFSRHKKGKKNIHHNTIGESEKGTLPYLNLQYERLQQEIEKIQLLVEYIGVGGQEDKRQDIISAATTARSKDQTSRSERKSAKESVKKNVEACNFWLEKLKDQQKVSSKELHS